MKRPVFSFLLVLVLLVLSGCRITAQTPEPETGTALTEPAPATESICETKDTSISTQVITEPATEVPTEPPTEAPTEATTVPTEPVILPEYQPLYEMNDHRVGWIKIEGTKVNYPVMQTPEQENYYLSRGFDRQFSRFGSIYVRESCDVNRPSDNITIYGHNMTDKSMFGALSQYLDPAFYEEHPIIIFDTDAKQVIYCNLTKKENCLIDNSPRVHKDYLRRHYPYQVKGSKLMTSSQPAHKLPCNI